MRHAELDLTLRVAGDGYAADLSFRAPDSAAALARGVPVTLDLPALTERAGTAPPSPPSSLPPRRCARTGPARGFIQGAITPPQPPES
jgi:hypothetical protein